jgi:putative FmdB family regulatory protein
MPTYDYGCIDCGERFEVTATLSEKEKGLEPMCPKCDSKHTVQLFNNVFFLKSAGQSTNAAFQASGCCGPNAGPGCCG